MDTKNHLHDPMYPIPWGVIRIILFWGLVWAFYFGKLPNNGSTKQNLSRKSLNTTHKTLLPNAKVARMNLMLCLPLGLGFRV